MAKRIETRPADMTQDQRSEAISKLKLCLKEAGEVARDLTAMLTPAMPPTGSGDKELQKMQLNITAGMLIPIGQAAVTHDDGLHLLPSEQLKIPKAVYDDCMGRKR